MSTNVLVLVLVYLALMAGSAFFSSAETAFFALNPLNLRRISQRNPAAGKRIHDILAKPTQLLSTILIGNTIVNVAIAAVGFTLAESFFPQRGERYSIPVVTILLIIFCEVGPKRVGLAITEKLAGIYSLAIPPLERIATPLRLLLEALTRRFEPVFRARGRSLTEEEFETVLDISGEQGVLNADELAMIKAIVNLEDVKASNVMTPRVDVIGLDVADDLETYLARARQSKRNFLLIYRDQMDSPEGFLDVRKFLLDPQHQVAAACVPLFCVPATTPLNQLLLRLHREHKRIAVVVDEYGGTAGVVTRGDVLEVITGEIYDELSKPRPVFQPAGPHSWLVDASIRLDELNRTLRLHLHAEGADRLAGWIAAHAGHLPQREDVVEAQGCRVTVEQTVKQRVTLALIEKLEAPE